MKKHHCCNRENFSNGDETLESSSGFCGVISTKFISTIVWAVVCSWGHDCFRNGRKGCNC